MIHGRKLVAGARCEREVSRRALVCAAGGAAVVAMMLAVATRESRAQEVTMAAPNALGPALPPEVADHAADWPLLDGIVRGFDTASGQEIWHYQAGAGINAPLAIAGDLLLVPAGGPFFPTTDSPPAAQNELIAFRLGARPVATPQCG